MARKKRGRRAYATDLTVGQWAPDCAAAPRGGTGGRPRKAPTRELVVAILYFLRAGYEQLTAVAETLIIIAATATLIRRWP